MLEKIKNSCIFVSENSKHVTINKDKLIEFSSHMKNINLDHWLSSSPFGLLDLSTEKIINFLLLYESINFSFWGKHKWEVETSEGKLDGSSALLYVMLEYIKNNESFDFSMITRKEFNNILKGNVKIPLFEERYRNIKQVSDVINKKMNSNFYEFIKDINSDDELFNVIINNFSCFKDERNYKGEKIYFYKLAQLLTSDIFFIKSIKDGIKVDCNNLIGCADYKIPQVLRALDILNYNEELANLIDNNYEIEENSDYEVEIRANMIRVILDLEKQLKSKSNCILINDYLYSQKNNIKLEFKPYHLTRNKNY